MDKVIRRKGIINAVAIKEDYSDTPELSRVEEIGEGFVNGNISWVKEQIGHDMKLFLDVLDWLVDFSPGYVEKFKRIMRGASLKKKATGEPDQDYDHKFYDELVKQLGVAGFQASHREFDKYKGVYLKVDGVDTFWTIEYYVMGYQTDESKKRQYSEEPTGVYVLSPESSENEINIEIYQDPDGTVDASILIEYCKEVKQKKQSSSIKKKATLQSLPIKSVELVYSVSIDGNSSDITQEQFNELRVTTSPQEFVDKYSDEFGQYKDLEFNENGNYDEWWTYGEYIVTTNDGGEVSLLFQDDDTGDFISIDILGEETAEAKQVQEFLTNRENQWNSDDLEDLIGTASQASLKKKATGDEAWAEYEDVLVNVFGGDAKEMLDNLVKALSDDELRENLSFIKRMYDYNPKLSKEGE